MDYHGNEEDDRLTSVGSGQHLIHEKNNKESNREKKNNHKKKESLFNE